MTITESKVECTACLTTEDMMPGLDMCKDCYGKAFDVLEFDELGNPKFQTMEQLMKYTERLELAKKNKPVAKKAPAKKSRKKKPADPVDKGKDTVANLDRSYIFQSTHFYTRQGDTFIQARTDAKQAKQLSNETNTVVFVHDHFFGEACNDKCQEME